MDAKEGLVVFEAVLNQIPREQRGEFASGINGLLTEIGAAALDGANEVGEASVDVMSLLTPEQQEKASKLTSAMAEKFGVDQKDFSVLTTETETGEQKFTVAYTAGNGIHKGSWNNIFNKKNAQDFMIEIDGKKVDTRTGMTLDAYKAMIDKARTTEALPDSPQLAGENGQPWTWTLRTGEEADGFYAPSAFANSDGYVDANWNGRDRGDDGVRFRPAVVLE